MLHSCVEVEERMQLSSGQHKEVGKCTRQRNYDNLIRFMAFLNNSTSLIYTISN